jgi:D-glycero-D-manno-heptose 1,7-bisphosphate phosphatase
MSRAVFFDRDGVINELVSRDGFYYSPREISSFKLVTGIKKIINYIKKKGYLVIVISNQPDIARGFMRNSELNKMTKILYEKLYVDDVLYCIHDEFDYCKCRKPKSGMIIKSEKKWKINLKKSLMIGDTEKDLGAANNAGIKFVLINSAYNNYINNCERIEKLNDIKKFIT